MMINFDTHILGLDGNPIDRKISDVLAEAISMSSMGNPLKVMVWAYDLTKTGEIDLNELDIQMLAKIVETSVYLTNLAKFQILKMLNP
jgi:hypothetical protein